MNFTEINDITKHWSEFLNLDTVFDDLMPISLCLDAQRRFNEEHQFEPRFMRLNIPLVIRVFKESKAYKRNHFVNYKETVDRQICMLKTKFRVPVNGTHNLDVERDYLEEITPHIIKEVDALFSDIMGKEVIFHGFGCLNDGTITFSFSK